jgi:hypothetical protein
MDLTLSLGPCSQNFEEVVHQFVSIVSASVVPPLLFYADMSISITFYKPRLCVSPTACAMMLEVDNVCPVAELNRENS